MEKPINGSVIPAKAGIQIVNKLDTGSGKTRPVLSLPKGRCDGAAYRISLQITDS